MKKNDTSPKKWKKWKKMKKNETWQPAIFFCRNLRYQVKKPWPITLWICTPPSIFSVHMLTNIIVENLSTSERAIFWVVIFIFKGIADLVINHENSNFLVPQRDLRRICEPLGFVELEKFDRFEDSQIHNLGFIKHWEQVRTCGRQ